MGNYKKYIIKASGDRVIFSRSKLERSLQRSGASAGLVKKISAEVEKRISDGDSTQDIYRLAFDLLKKAKEQPVAARYSLKKAIMELGPTGFPFENFIGELLRRRGLQTKVGVVIEGACVRHEVDVEAEDGQNHYFIECKFHNRPGANTDVKIPLYVHSRFNDIIKKIKEKGQCHFFHQAWVVTNTKLSGDAIKYSECSGIKAIGWRYPREGGLESLIEDTALHPLTCLTSLNNQEKSQLLQKGIVLMQDIPLQKEIISSLGVSEERWRKILKEISAISKSPLKGRKV